MGRPFSGHCKTSISGLPVVTLTLISPIEIDSSYLWIKDQSNHPDCRQSGCPRGVPPGAFPNIPASPGLQTPKWTQI